MSATKPVLGYSWEVKSRAKECAGTGRAFEAGELIYSRLVPRVDGPHREDYSEEAWSEALRDSSLFHWQTRFRPPAPRKEPPFREDNAEELLRDLVERDDPEWINTLYILALLLERKRILLDRGSQRDPSGRKIRIYERKDSGETFLIVDPEPDLERIAELQDEVARHLGWVEPETGSETEDPGAESGEEPTEEKSTKPGMDE